MLIRWSRHAKLRFAERAVLLGINYGDIEIAIKKQIVKIREELNKFRAVFRIGETFLTVVKLETKSYIHVLTLWESNEKEAELWKKK